MGLHVIHRAVDLQIAFFFNFLYFGQPPLHHHSTTAPPRQPHRNNDATLLPRRHRNNASILLPRQHHTAAIILHPPTIASTSSSSSCYNTTPKGRRNRHPRLLVLGKMAVPHVRMSGSGEIHAPFSPDQWASVAPPTGPLDPDICIRGV